MTSTPRILLFDSGVGGLSILQEIRKQYPDCSFIYASDNAAFPYGLKKEQELIERVDKVLQALQEITQPDIIVVACNTASTVALPRIRARFEPVIGVVPAIKPAALCSETHTIGLLGTPGTVTRPYTQELIDSHAKDCRVIRVGSTELVELAEQKLRGGNITVDKITAIVAPFAKAPDLDTLILACTHFPLLKPELQQALPHITHWIDSGEAIARRVGFFLEQLPPIEKDTIDNTSWFTLEDDNTKALTTALANYGLVKTEFLSL